jgi:hypothetical protein
MPDCQRCYKACYTCDVCKGEGSVPYTFGECTECNGTGWLCPDDGKWWNS